jgi:hypothetical protein
MAAAVFNFDATRAPAVAGACICHGECEPWSVRQRGRPPTPLVSSAVIRPLLNLVVARMLDAQCAVPGWALRPHPRHLSLLRADRWIEDASVVLREPALGLMALAHVERGVGDVVEFAAERAPQVIDALLVMTRLMTTVNEAASVHLCIEGGSVVMAIGSHLNLSNALRDYFVGSLALAVSRWIGSEIEMEVWFTGARPSYSSAYRRALGEIAVGFGAPCDALVLPTSSLMAAMPLADRNLHNFLVGIAQRFDLGCSR